MSDTRTAHLFRELLDWREGMRESGRGADLLPTDGDLLLLAGATEIKRPALETLGLERTSALSSFGAGILSAMRTGLANYEAGLPAPTLPAPFAAAIAPPPPPPPAAPVQPVAAPPSSLLSGFRAGLARGRGESEPPSNPEEPEPPVRTRRERKSGRDAASSTSADSSLGSDIAESETRSPASGFAPYDATRAAQEARMRAIVSTRPDGGLLIQWQPPPTLSRVRIYRVIVSDEWVPWSPDVSEVIATTTSTSTVFDREYAGPVRHLQVWVNEGPDDATARAAQPDLLASGQSVAPPSNVRLVEDHGTVYGSWKVASGVHRVDVLRVPIEATGGGIYLPQYLLSTSDAALEGIQDSECPAGEECEYRLFAVVVGADGELTSDPIVARITVGGSLLPVREIRAEVRDDAGRRVVDLEWDQPTAGSVRIYRTDRLPTATTSTGVLALSALPGTGLTDSFLIPTRPQWAAGIGSLRNVPWPPGWSRVHFTAVTFDRTNALIGGTATERSTGTIAEVALHQRVTWQLLTFSWPIGADEVHVYRGPVGAGLQEPPGSPLDRMDASTHRGLGGIRLKNKLDHQGCDVHLVPISFYDGAERGTPKTVTYKGLFRVAYQLTAVPVAGRMSGRRGGNGPVSTLRTVVVQGDWADPPAGLQISLTLVARTKRMPLSVSDGNPIAAPWQGPAPARNAWTPVAQFDASALPPGSYVRLFLTADNAAIDIALLDPALSELRT